MKNKIGTTKNCLLCIKNEQKEIEREKPLAMRHATVVLGHSLKHEISASASFIAELHLMYTDFTPHFHEFVKEAGLSSSDPGPVWHKSVQTWCSGFAGKLQLHNKKTATVARENALM